MLGFLKSFFKDPTKDWERKVTDPILGELLLNQDATWWDAFPEITGKKINFQIGGTGSPDAALIQHAHDIIDSYETFEENVRAELGKEIEKFKEYEDEIRKQEIESIALFWPERPNDGMIFLKGPDEFRLWRFDYINRKPKGLGFDD